MNSFQPLSMAGRKGERRAITLEIQAEIPHRRPLHPTKFPLQISPPPPSPHTATPPPRPRENPPEPDPHWCTDPRGGRRPINARAANVARLPMFREAYAQRRCIVPVDGFFEWRAIKAARAKQPYAIAMKDGSPFGLAGLWENWRNPSTGEWERTLPLSGAFQRAGGANPRSDAGDP